MDCTALRLKHELECQFRLVYQKHGLHCVNAALYHYLLHDWAIYDGTIPAYADPHLAGMIGCAKDTLKKAADALAQLGLIIVERQRGNGNKTRYELNTTIKP